MEYPCHLKEISHLPKFQTGKHSNYTNDISGVLRMKRIGILLLVMFKKQHISENNFT